MATHTFDLPSFRAMFPEFVETDKVALSAYWTMATSYIAPDDGPILTGQTLQMGLNLMTAHIAKEMTSTASGGSTGIVQSATEGSVSVSMVAPPVKSQWGWWLNKTPYGQQLLALLKVQSAGGLYVGGSLERSAFRKAGGVW